MEAVATPPPLSHAPWAAHHPPSSARRPPPSPACQPPVLHLPHRDAAQSSSSWILLAMASATSLHQARSRLRRAANPHHLSCSTTPPMYEVQRPCREKERRC
ncbi:hypothetical protein VPH35_129383 [Triticum aestivum]